MVQCKYCIRAQEMSKDSTGHVRVTMCRACYRRKRADEALKRERSQKKAS
jgi:hypothetical protein